MGEDEEERLNREFEGFNSPDQREEHRKRVKRISRELAEDVESNWKPFIVVTSFLVILGLTLVFINFDLPNEVLPDSGPETEIEGEIVNVNLTNRDVEPVRPTISRKDGIRFVNKGSYTFNLSFDRDVQSFVLRPGEEKVVDIKSILYYNATPVNTDGRMLKAGVNIE
jgi:hypothetical protein